MHIETATQRVVQLLIKGDDYEILCPNDEDAWYNLEEVIARPKLMRMLEAGTLQNLKDGKIDFIVQYSDGNRDVLSQPAGSAFICRK